MGYLTRRGTRGSYISINTQQWYCSVPWIPKCSSPILRLSFYLCVWIFCLRVYKCATCAQCLQNPERASSRLELELQIIVQILIGINNKNSESAIRGECWRSENQKSQPLALTSASDQMGNPVSMNHQTACCLYKTSDCLWAPVSSCLQFLSPPSHTTPVSTSLVLGFKACDPKYWDPKYFVWALFSFRQIHSQVGGLELTEIHLPLSPEYWD